MSIKTMKIQSPENEQNKINHYLTLKIVMNELTVTAFFCCSFWLRIFINIDNISAWRKRVIEISHKHFTFSNKADHFSVESQFTHILTYTITQVPKGYWAINFRILLLHPLYFIKLQMIMLIGVLTYFRICNLCRSEYSVEKNFRILDKGKNDFEITIKESLHIKNDRPPLKKKLMTQGTSFL